MARYVTVEGRRLRVPDDATEAEINELFAAPSAAASAAAPSAETQKPPVTATPGLVETILDPIGGAIGGAANLGVNILATPFDLLRMGKQADDLAAPGRDMTKWYNKPLTDYIFSPEVNQKITEARESTFGTVDAVRKAVDEGVYQPTTGPGKFVKAAVPWVAPAAFPSKAARAKQGVEKAIQIGSDVLAQGAAPWAAYEAAKKYVGNDGAALLAALFTGMGTSALRTLKTPEAMTARDYRGTPDTTWDRIIGLQEGQQARHGLDITPAESAAQVTNQAQHPALIGQRSIEATPAGQEIAGPYLAERGPQSTRAFTEQVLDPLAPRPAEPHRIGPDISEAAQNEIRRVEQQRTAAEQPHYQAADPTHVDRAAMDTFVTDLDAEIARYNPESAIGNVLRQFRNRLVNRPAQPGTPGTPASRTPVFDPKTGKLIRYNQTPATPGTPDVPEQVAYDRLNLDTVKKEFREATRQGQVGQVAIPSNVKGVMGGMLDRLDTILETGSPEYQAGKQVHGDVTRNVVQPTAQGPIGDLAAASTTEQVGNILFPNKPRANDLAAMTDAMTRLRAQAADLTGAARQKFDQILSEVSGGKSRSGNQEWIGADLAKSLAGDPAKRARTMGMLRAIGAGPVADTLESMVEGFQAMGKRLAPNSATSQNIQRSAEMSTTPATEAMNAVTTGKPWSVLNDLFKEYILRSNQRRAAELAFGSARDARAAAATAWDTVLPEAAKRTGLSALYTYLTSPDEQQAR